jgi:hypothetical protein
VQRGDGVGPAAQLERQDGHAERLAFVALPDTSQIHEPAGRQRQRIAERPEMLFDQLAAEAIVPCRDRRVGREHDLRRGAAHGFADVDALGFHPSAHELQDRKRTVAFV